LAWVELIGLEADMICERPLAGKLDWDPEVAVIDYDGVHSVVFRVVAFLMAGYMAQQGYR
jgi:hypothetical protein